MEASRTSRWPETSHGRRLTVTATAARVFHGTPEEARGARGWVRVLAEAVCGLTADDAELAAGELFSNAVTHTRSGACGGKVTVVVAPDGDGVAVHVHDQGAGDSQMPGVLPFGGDLGLLECGRGLQIVDWVSAGWGTGPAARCAHAAADDPAVPVGGRCTWFRLQGGPVTDHRAGSGTERVMVP